MSAAWLQTKRYVVFSDKAQRFVSLTTNGMKRWRENGRHFVGPMPRQEAIEFVQWLNKPKIRQVEYVPY